MIRTTGYCSHALLKLGRAMELPRESHASVQKLFEMLDIVEFTRFQKLSDVWRDRTMLSIDYYLGPTGLGAVSVYYACGLGRI